MKGLFSIVALVAALLFAATPALAAGSGAKGKAGAESGEKLFQQHCAVCHPDGGNIINPKKTLRSKDLQANNITKPEDIVKVMRNPGPGMPTFDEKTIPDPEAREIGEYILKSFK
jgi:cytochrome c6